MWNWFKRHDIFISIITLASLILLLSACTERGVSAEFQQIPGSDPEQGKESLKAYGCQSCHTIPGVRGANATVGPSLKDWASRHYIAGNLPNTPDNLILWIQNPQEVEPTTAMPNLDVTEQDARNMSAYLYTLDD
jgi:cytochrome c1